MPQKHQVAQVRQKNTPLCDAFDWRIVFIGSEGNYQRAKYM